MAVKIRLQRKGRKKAAFYYIVVADSRSPRDGRFIERLGAYNPLPLIPEIELDADKAIRWLNDGAVPTKTVKDILSKEGVLYKKHLQRGVKMNVISQEEADKKYAEFLEKRSEKISEKIQKINASLDKKAKSILEKEAKISEMRARKLMDKKAAEIRGKHVDSEEAEAEMPETAEATDTQGEEAIIAEESSSDVQLDGEVEETPAEE